MEAKSSARISVRAKKVGLINKQAANALRRDEGFGDLDPGSSHEEPAHDGRHKYRENVRR